MCPFSGTIKPLSRSSHDTKIQDSSPFVSCVFTWCFALYRLCPGPIHILIFPWFRKKNVLSKKMVSSKKSVLLDTITALYTTNNTSIFVGLSQFVSECRHTSHFCLLQSPPESWAAYLRKFCLLFIILTASLTKNKSDFSWSDPWYPVVFYWGPPLSSSTTPSFATSVTVVRLADLCGPSSRPLKTWPDIFKSLPQHGLHVVNSFCNFFHNSLPSGQYQWDAQDMEST